MAEYCPKCNYKFKPTDWRPECPQCGVNVLYYGVEDREIVFFEGKPRVEAVLKIRSAQFGDPRHP